MAIQHHIAELNVARMKAPLDHSSMERAEIEALMATEERAPAIRLDLFHDNAVIYKKLKRYGMQ